MAVEIQKTQPLLLPSWSCWMLGAFRNLTGDEIQIWNSWYFRKQLTLCLKLGIQILHSHRQVFSHP